jgi:hypothetical protein
MGFRLVLSGLYESEDEVIFVIHAKPTSWGMGVLLQPGSFLARLGYQRQQRCPVIEDDCFWVPIAKLQRDPFVDRDLVERVHAAFGAHADRLPKAYEAYKQIVDAFRVADTDNLDLFPELRDYQPLVLKLPPGGIPDWADAEMPPSYGAALEDAKRSIGEVKELRTIAGLLWATGEDLEVAVRDAFRDIGYTAQRTAKGTTYDVTVELAPSKRFLVEVTGVEGMLKKDSNKIGQALAAQQVAQAGDRILIALNAHRETPVKKRAGLEPVSREALDLLTRLNVSVIETSHLFEIWKAHTTDSALATTRVGDLYSAPGGLFSRA